MLNFITVPLCFFSYPTTEKKQTHSYNNLYPLFQRAILFLKATYSSLENNLPSYLYSCAIVFSLIGLGCSIFLHGTLTPLIFTILAIICFIAKQLQKHLVKQNSSLKKDTDNQKQVILNLSETLVQKEMRTEELVTLFTDARKQLNELTERLTNSLAQFQKTLLSESQETKDVIKKFLNASSPLTIIDKLDQLLKLSTATPDMLALIFKQNAESLELLKSIHKKVVVDKEDVV